MRDAKNFIRRKNFRLYKEDCLKVLKKIPEESIDFIITDPPYNLGLFMKNRQTNINALRNNHFAGKGWDDLEYDHWKDKIMKKICILLIQRKRGSISRLKLRHPHSITMEKLYMIFMKHL